MKLKLLGSMLLLLLASCGNNGQIEKITTNVHKHNLVYNTMPTGSFYAFPLGNGTIGSQIWHKGDTLRMSLDNANLWDLRPMKDLDKLNFKMVQEHVAKNDYGIIQKLGDAPYLDNTAPCKILGAALTYDASSLGDVTKYELDLFTASCNVTWNKGATLESFVHATKPVGWFKFTNVPEDFVPSIEPPVYKGSKAIVGGIGDASQKVSSLGYEQGPLKRENNMITYDQEGWGGFTYQVAVKWERKGNGIEGVWSVSAKYPKDNILFDENATLASQEVESAFEKGFNSDRDSHRAWWSEYWNQSSISIPAFTKAEQYWFLEQYKFGSSGRRGAPAIGLLGVWANDDGLLPQWKGDYHNDVNTQFPYWTAYSSNHLEGEWSLIDWLWKLRPVFRKYTKDYFGVEGLNVPGVCTIDGQPMGGWIQYANGPTVSLWFAHHFYSHWRYSMDREFLKERAFPWFEEVITYVENMTVRNKDGMRKLPLSSSPEYNGNGINAWYKETSNFDLALVHFVYTKGAELAAELGYKDLEQKWLEVDKEWPDYDLDDQGGLSVAPGQHYTYQHIMHAHMHAIFPFNTINMYNGKKDADIMKASLKRIESLGETMWPMSTAAYYTHAWDAEGTLKRIEKDMANKAIHYNDNGEYKFFIKKTDHFFPIVIQEMMLQSHSGYVNVFPVIPDKWADCSFEKMRAEGAFLVSASRKGGKTQSVKIVAEKGGNLKLINPFGPNHHNDKAKENSDNTVWEFDCQPGEVIILNNK